MAARASLPLCSAVDNVAGGNGGAVRRLPGDACVTPPLESAPRLNADGAAPLDGTTAGLLLLLLVLLDRWSRRSSAPGVLRA